MKEIEIKYPITVKQYELLENKYREEFTDYYTQIDTYFDTGNKFTLRIREQNGLYEFVVKGPKKVDLSGVTSREEINVPVLDPIITKNAFNLMGYSKLASVEKLRYELKIGNIGLFLDKIISLNNKTFLEVEILADSESEAINKINNFVLNLGLDGLIPETRGYLDMVLENSNNIEIKQKDENV